MNLVLNLLAISRSIKPHHLGLIPKPSHLTFSIPSCVTLDYTNRIFVSYTGIERGNYVPVADRLERLGTRRDAFRQQPRYFIDKNRCEHLVSTGVYSTVKRFTRRIDAHEVHFETHQRIAWFFAQVLSQRLTCS